MIKLLYGCILAAFLACFCNYARAQTSFSSVKGRIVTPAGTPIEGATILLLTSPDSALFKAAVSSQNGVFTLDNIKPGNYILYVHKVGLAKYYNRYTLSGNDADAGDITLQQLNKQLTEVTVSAKKDYIEVHPDKMVMNVDRSIMAAGNSAFDVLQTAPGVRVIGNTILFKGGLKALVAINGKPIGSFTDEQLADLLRSYPSSIISQVELIQNPSARYDAAGGGGVINIILKKSKDEGFKASVTESVGAGHDYKSNTGINMNYLTGKFNFFGNYSFAAIKTKRALDVDRIIASAGTLTDIDVDYNSITTSRTHNFNGGVDYNLTPKQTLGVLVYGYASQSGIDKNSVTYIRNNNVLDSDITAGSHVNRPISNINYNLNYKGTFGKEDGTSLSADVDYATYSRSSFELVNNNFFLPDGITTYRDPLFYADNSPSTIRIRSERVDFSQQLSKKSTLSAGLKNSYVSSDNTIDFSQQDDTSRNFLPIPSLSDHFIYHETVNAAYASYNGKFGKTDLTLGLRTEQTNVHGISYHPDRVLSSKYVDFFPDARLEQQLDKDNLFGIDFERHIERPNYQDLNPFVGFISQYSYSEGNPFLKPMYENIFELSDLYKEKYKVSARAIITSNFVSPIYQQNDSTKSYTTTNANIGTRYAWEVEFYLPITITKWWETDVDIDPAYELYVFNADSARKATFDFGFMVNQIFTLPGGIQLNIDNHFQSGEYYGIKQYRAYDRLNAGISKAILQNQGTIKLAASDIFNSDVYNYTSNYLNINLRGHEKQPTQFVTLTFTYRFGKKTVKAAAKHQGGNADNQQRLSGSSNEN